jgi:Tfp pilus assembly PilM family ATPase
MSALYQIGVNFTGNQIQLAEIKFDRNQYYLSRLDEIESDIDFHNPELSEIISNPELAFKIVKDLSKIIKRNNLSAVKASIALSAASIFIITIPIDECTTGKDLREHLEWELSNFFPGEPVSVFNIGTYPLKSEDGIKNILLVVVRKDVILFLKNIFNRLNIETMVFDIDHFAAIQSLSKNYPQSMNDTTILLGMRNNFIDFSILENGTLIKYNGRRLGHEKLSYSNAADQLISLVNNNNGKVWYLFGKDVKEGLIGELRSRIPHVKIEILNPFRTLELSSSLPRRQELMLDRLYFAPAVGIAYRHE